MKTEKTILGSKALAIIAIAVVFTIVMTTIIVSSSNKFSFTTLIPALKKKAPTSQNQNQGASPFQVLFGKSGNNEVYKVQKDDKWAVIVNGQESALYDEVANPTFSPDGLQFAYSATLNGEEFVILGNEPAQKSYLDIRQILFNADGSLLAYLAETENGSLVVVNGAEGELYEDIGTMETELGITFLKFTSDNQIVYRAIEGQKTFIVVNTDEGQKYAEIKEIYFSADGTQVAYYAQEGNNLFTIIDGQITATQSITPETPVTPVTPVNPTLPPVVPTNPSASKLKAKDPARNLDPDIDKQPEGLAPLICGQTTDCNF